MIYSSRVRFEMFILRIREIFIHSLTESAAIWLKRTSQNANDFGTEEVRREESMMVQRQVVNQ